MIPALPGHFIVFYFLPYFYYSFFQMCFIYISVVTTNTNGHELKCWHIKTTFELIFIYEIPTKSLILHRVIYSIERFLKNLFLLLPINRSILEQTNDFIIQIIAKIIHFFEIIRIFFMP